MPHRLVRESGSLGKLGTGNGIRSQRLKYLSAPVLGGQSADRRAAFVRLNSRGQAISRPASSSDLLYQLACDQVLQLGRCHARIKTGCFPIGGIVQNIPGVHRREPHALTFGQPVLAQTADPSDNVVAEKGVAGEGHYERRYPVVESGCRHAGLPQ